MQENIVALKLHNGTDIVGSLLSETDHHVMVDQPVEMQFGPAIGFYAKSYLLLAEGSAARFRKRDLLLLAPANSTAVEYYDEFRSRLEADEDERQAVAENLDPDTEDYEEMMLAIHESKFSRIH